MFESAEVGHELDKETWSETVPRLREELLDAQFDLLQKKGFATLVLVSGVDGAGKGDTVNVLNTWLDPRHVATHAFAPPGDEERRYPSWHRFWAALPPRGKIGIFFGSWYTEPILRRVYGETSGADLDQALDEIERMERMLSEERVLLVKLWFHLSKKQQDKRLRGLSSDKRSRWRVTDTDWRHFALYDRFRKVSERALRRTSVGEAPWNVIEGVDARYRAVTAGTLLRDAIRGRLASETKRPSSPAAPFRSETGAELLRTLDHDARLDRDEYDERLEELQGRLAMATRNARFQDVSLAIVFEGPDAAGKGGAIRRITQALDARIYDVVPIAAPTDEEKAHPYLWRFWRHVPRHGRIVIYDRSWYGRVLVERIEHFARDNEWQRAYAEIDAFEEQLHRHGTVVVKIWLQTSKDEQMRRFQEREETGFKRHKITKEDWRNRERWEEYEVAASDAFTRTSSEHAPWTLIAADDKLHARIRVLETVVEALERGIARAAKKRKRAKRS